MNQQDKLKNLLANFCNERESRTFSLKELNARYGDYQIIGIGGKTPQATVRRLLQSLRDENIVTFVDNSGHYTLRSIDFLDAEKRDLANIDISRELPEKREYISETYIRNTLLVKQAIKVLGDKCICKGCQNTFKREDGSNYIEVHHITPLCTGGEDTLSNLAVLCAHHHRMAHYADIQTKKAIQANLLAEVSKTYCTKD